MVLLALLNDTRRGVADAEPSNDQPKVTEIQILGANLGSSSFRTDSPGAVFPYFMDYAAALADLRDLGRCDPVGVESGTARSAVGSNLDAFVARSRVPAVEGVAVTGRTCSQTKN